MHQVLETDRLFIRPLTTADNDFIFHLVNSPGWLQFIGDRNVTNAREAKAYIQCLLSDSHTFYCVYGLKENLQPVGVITLIQREGLEYPDIGFAMLTQYENNGFAKEACQAYLEALAKEKRYPFILGITLPDNTRSINLLQRLGLTFVRNHISCSETLAIYAKSLRCDST
jgi:RimJ/RimL family protein N-acetyltransferase